jgi:branched-subunit amino acid aminotransferase/4-amino-4-deoxychorismate lyase
MELEVPYGGADRVHRLAVSAKGIEVSERPVGSERSVALITSTAAHRPYPHKTTARDQFDRALAEAKRAGADDAVLLTENGRVAECGIWTLFWWGETGELCTPALALGVLPGVARERIGELTPLTERKVGRAALDARPLFVANAVRGIVAVRSLDGSTTPRAAETATLRSRFWG